MKKLLFIFAFMVISQTIFAQTASLDRFIRKHKRTAEGDKVDMTIPGFVIRWGSHFIDKDDLEGLDIRQIRRKIDELRIVNFEKATQIQLADFQQLMTELKAENFEELMTVREKGGERFNILLHERKGFIEDVLVIVSERNGEFSLINLAGRFTMEDINKMMKNVDFNSTKNNSR